MCTVTRAWTQAWPEPSGWVQSTNCTPARARWFKLWAVGFVSDGPSLHTPSRGRLNLSPWIKIGRRPCRRPPRVSLARSLSAASWQRGGAQRQVTSSQSSTGLSAKHLMPLCGRPRKSTVHLLPSPSSLWAGQSTRGPPVPLHFSSLAT